MRIKNTPINMLHNKVRKAHYLGLPELRDKYYLEYKKLGGKRNKNKLIATKPIYVKNNI